MKFLCEVNNKAFLFDEENLMSPKDVVRPAFEACDQQMNLDYDKDYKVSVYDESGLSTYYTRKDKVRQYSCHINKYSYEIECKEKNAYSACVSALLEIADEVVFDGREELEIVAESDEEGPKTYYFSVCGPANG